MTVRMVTDKARMVLIEKSVRAVVKGDPKNRHIIAVHDAMCEPDGLPLGNEGGCANRNFQIEPGVGVGDGKEIRKILGEDVICQRLDMVGLAPPVEELKMTESNVARRQPQQGCAGLHLFAKDFL